VLLVGYIYGIGFAETSVVDPFGAEEAPGPLDGWMAARICCWALRLIGNRSCGKLQSNGES
jgi:hypothetical protein